MRIDAHQHFWQFDAVRDAWMAADTMAAIRQDFMPPQLLPHLVQHGFDGCVAVQADQSEQETEFLLALAAQYPFIKAVVGWIDLQADTLPERLTHFRNFELLKGFRHILQAENEDFFSKEKFIKGLQLIGSEGFTYDLLIYASQLPAACRLVDKLGNQPLVLDHLGKPAIATQAWRAWKDGIKTLAQHPQLFCKISGMVTEANWQHWKAEDCFPYLDVVMEAFGEDRLMYGSDWPVCLLAATYQQQLEVVTSYLATNALQHLSDKIFGQNAVRFYGIESR